MEHAVLVQLDIGGRKNTQDADEFIELVKSAGAETTALIQGTRHTPTPRYFAGTGKAEEIKQAVQVHGADVVIFNHTLSPAQERNLEQLFECRVLDRTRLILDIFAQRARSHEGKLQVELAQLKHMSTRLIRGWTHLERQKGGIGMRGPGETQLETDRRLLNIRIKQIKKRLEKVGNQRKQGRQSRQKAQIPTVSLVGYTNAGKSTLFNCITASEVYVADQLFATLDPTMRRVELSHQQSIILVDTVGFIRDLPHDLVVAFRATLQETAEADLILHVIDSHDEQRDMYRQQVNEVIRQLGAEDVPQIEVMNKIDLSEHTMRIDPHHSGVPTRAWLSAHTAHGVDALLDFLGKRFAKAIFSGTITLAPRHARLRAKLYEDHAIISEQSSPQGDYLLTLKIHQYRLKQLLDQENIKLENITTQ
ncbi:MAG: GTPase HflX [Cocleimonas sp.]|nr:GTPase HflX [Cocleimonas sp.]